MNISEAKQIPIKLYVEALGGRYSHTDRKGELWYFSVFRPDEKTASMKINEATNQWHDFGLSTTFAHNHQGSGGDIIDLWCDYHFKDRRLGISDALIGLKSFTQNNLVAERIFTEKPTVKPIIKKTEPRFKILKIMDRITNNGLKEELQARRISPKLANEYLRQGYILDTATQKKYTAFLFENDKGGYEVSIPNPKKEESFKTCIGPKSSSRILIEDDKHSANVFEGFWDFLTWCEFKQILKPENHTYVLNSTSLVGEVCKKIIAYKDTIDYVFLFMDNDEAGYQATHALAKNLVQEEIKVASLEQFYSGYKDLNEFWTKSPHAKFKAP